VLRVRGYCPSRRRAQAQRLAPDLSSPQRSAGLRLGELDRAAQAPRRRRRGRHRHIDAFPRYLVAQFGCACFVTLATQAMTWIWRPGHLTTSIASAVLSGGLSYVISITWVFSRTGGSTTDD